MTTSVEGYFLVAHCVNAVSLDRAEVYWEVASESISGEWYTNSGNQITPFLTIPITDPTPKIPEGWIEHLHELARKFACANPEPKISLLETLGLAKPKAPQPIHRRF
jgi:hypothetical protein